MNRSQSGRYTQGAPDTSDRLQIAAVANFNELRRASLLVDQDAEEGGFVVAGVGGANHADCLVRKCREKLVHVGDLHDHAGGSRVRQQKLAYVIGGLEIGQARIEIKGLCADVLFVVNGQRQFCSTASFLLQSLNERLVS
jgi:hypothetical protein